MTDTVRQIARQAPKSGPWIIGYAVAIASASVAGANGIITGPQSAIPFWIAIIGCTVMIVLTSWRRHRLLGSVSPAVRSFWKRFVTASAAMFLAYCMLAYAQMMGQWSDSAIRIVALLPFIGLAGMIWAPHQYVADETDEFLRARAARQLMTASFLTLGGAALWSALSTAGVLPKGQLGYVILLWFAGLGIGRLVNELKP